MIWLGRGLDRGAVLGREASSRASARRRSPAVASKSARRNRSGVSRVPGVSRSIPNASKISAIESR